MNTVKNFTTIDFRLNQTNVLEVAIVSIYDISNKRCVPSKAENLNLNVFEMITGINESKSLTKHVSCKCKFNERNYNSDKLQNNDKYRCGCKKRCICEKDYV